MNEIPVMHSGSGRGEYFLGLQCRFGRKGERDFVKTAKLLKASSDKAHVRAMICLGFAYFEGEGVNRDRAIAFTYWKQAADRGHPYGEYLVGRCFEQGIGTYKNLQNALYYYRRAADQNHPESLYRLLVLQDNPYHSEIDIGTLLAEISLDPVYEKKVKGNDPYKETIRCLQRAKDADSPRAHGQLGLCHIKGFGVQRNYEKAFEICYRGAELEDPLSIFIMGLFYHLGCIVKKDECSAFSFFQRALHLGYNPANYYYGAALYHGFGVLKDQKLGLQYLETASKNGCERATKEVAVIEMQRRKIIMNMLRHYWGHNIEDFMGFIPLGLIYLTGYGVEKKIEVAEGYFFKMLVHKDRMHPELLYKIGTFWWEGCYFKKNWHLGLRCLRSAAKRGSRRALSVICDYYKEMRCYDVLFKFLDAFAQRDNPFALLQLSDCYKFGLGVDKDEELSLKYFTRAKELDQFRDEPKEYFHFATEEEAFAEIRRAEKFLSIAIDNDPQFAASILHKLRLEL